MNGFFLGQVIFYEKFYMLLSKLNLLLFYVPFYLTLMNYERIPEIIFQGVVKNKIPQILQLYEFNSNFHRFP